MESEKKCFSVCPECQGTGKKSRGLSKKAQAAHRAALAHFESTGTGTAPTRPKAHLYPCHNCNGIGIIPSFNYPAPDTVNYPNIAIIGGGIGGVALAVACLHRGIPFTLYERDADFHARSQGYGLTLQQAGKAVEALGILSLKDKVISSKHIVHTTDGKVIGEWGNRKWTAPENTKAAKRSNMHIARQSLRKALLEQLGDDNVQWSHQLTGFTEAEDGTVQLSFLVNSENKTAKADLVVGADGIRSIIRKQVIGDVTTPLRYLDCIVILGICPLTEIKNTDGTQVNSILLDSATVFQTANGNERIYMMPYTADSVMWQLSFPMAEDDAKALSNLGQKALKEEACRRTQWHSPIPQIMAATPENCISGYPVYDRELLTAELLQKGKKVTLIGDAAHPMSPFKGQGANQALLDALSLARSITKGCRPGSGWQHTGVRQSVLNDFEAEMLSRSAVKVKDSAAAAQFLHSDVVLTEADSPRGSCAKKND